jgi:hypothetical protein
LEDSEKGKVVNSSINKLRINRLSANATVSVIPMTARIVSSKAKKGHLPKPSGSKLTHSSSKGHKKKGYKPLAPFRHSQNKGIPSRNRDVKKSKSISTNFPQFSVGLKGASPYAKLSTLKSSFEASKSPHDLKKIREGDDYFSTSQGVTGNINQTQEIYLEDSEKGTVQVPTTAKNSTFGKTMALTLNLPSKKNQSPHKLNTPLDREKFKGRVWGSGVAPHGGATGFNNEERLTFQTVHNQPKFEPQASFEQREKSVELSVKSGQLSSVGKNMLTEKLINSNKLSKYLTGFIGGKDFRTTEERELQK